MCHKVKEQIDTYSVPKWLKLNPDYEIHTYDNEGCKTFLLSEYGPLYRDIFDYISDGPIKADFWRVCILYKYGGVYADADINPLVPIASFLEADVQFLTCVDCMRTKLNPHIILTVKEHPILKWCIDRYVEYYSRNVPYEYWPWSITTIMTAAFRQCVGLTTLKEGIVREYQFITEILPTQTNYNSAYCKYKGVRLLNNRQPNYNAARHEFT